jgi:hypothetical protein
MDAESDDCGVQQQQGGAGVAPGAPAHHHEHHHHDAHVSQSTTGSASEGSLRSVGAGPRTQASRATVHAAAPRQQQQAGAAGFVPRRDAHGNIPCFVQTSALFSNVSSGLAACASQAPALALPAPPTGTACVCLCVSVCVCVCVCLCVSVPPPPPPPTHTHLTPPPHTHTRCASVQMCGYCGTRSTSGCWRRGWEVAPGAFINLCNKCGVVLASLCLLPATSCVHQCTRCSHRRPPGPAPPHKHTHRTPPPLPQVWAAPQGRQAGGSARAATPAAARARCCCCCCDARWRWHRPRCQLPLWRVCRLGWWCCW